MELQTISSSPRNIARQLIRRRNIELFQKNLWISKCSIPQFGAICSLNFPAYNPFLPSKLELLSSKVIYSVASAMGHNKESHPECNSRVPAIVDTLSKMQLTPQFRSTEIVELKKFRSATVDDIASVHERAYVSGLEMVMEKASEQGLILIEGSGPTYATSTTFNESLLAAGAGLSLVDAVVISHSDMGFHWLNFLIHVSFE